MFGTPVKVVPINQPAYVGCNFGPSNTAQLKRHGELIVTIFPHATAGSWQQVIETYTHQAGGHAVSDLGDAALVDQFTAGGGTTTYVAVLDGALAVVVQRVIFSGPAAPVAAVISLTRTVLSSL